MAFHIPFNQRASAQRRPAPVYIGFEAPLPPRKKFNWWGFNGMWMSFASLATAGVLSPVPLIISLIGLRRPGKKMATVGTLVSLAGIALITTMVVGTSLAHQARKEHRRMAYQKQSIKKQVAETSTMMALAADNVLEETSHGFLPSDLRANELVIGLIDPWGKSLRFDMEAKGGNVRSAGPDRKFNSKDDLTLWVDGKTDVKKTLLDVKKKNVEKKVEDELYLPTDF
ncbi:MAG: hypothetical protein ACI87E_002766 [Mariniblastus sp.]|jgi:hypothetical protein